MDAAGTGERECWRCQTGPGAALLCPRCDAPLPLPPDADLFAVLGLPRRLAVDAADLEGRYHAMSRAVHPDRHTMAGDRERELSLVVSAAVNRAYRTLRDPIARGRYWLELHGVPLGENNKDVPPALAAEVFETQETLEKLRAGETPALRRAVEARRDALGERLARLQDEVVSLYAAEPALADLKRRLSEIAYLRTLAGDIGTALGDLRGADSRH